MSVSLQRTLPSRVLCLVTDLDLAGGAEPLRRIVAKACAGGVNMVQVRAHALPVEDLARLAMVLIASSYQDVLVTVNGPLEAAIESGASAIHLPEQTVAAREISLEAHRRGLLVGRSVHSASSAARAVEEGADYLFMGTVFASRSHPGGPVCGLAGVREAVESSAGKPVIGIGGISHENAKDVISTGASGVAVIGAIIGAPDPTKAAQLISSAIIAA